MKLFKRLISLALTAAIGLSICACGSSDSSSSKNDANRPPEKTGTFVITLYPNYAPITVENFQNLVNDGFYNGLTFHRVMDGFMAQGGSSDGFGYKGSDKTIKGEFAANGVENNLSHKRGIVSMGRTSADMDSASSQFFICYSDEDTFLDGNYAAFGEVTEGMDVVDDLLNCERVANEGGELAMPVYPITITNAKMLETAEGENPKAEFTLSYYPKA